MFLNISRIGFFAEKEQGNMLWLPDILAITSILVSAMTIFMLVTVQLRKNAPRSRKFSNHKTGDEQLHQRPLGKMEAVLHNLHRDGSLQVSMAALTTTSNSLEEDVILKVVKHFCDKHPLLRMRLVEIDGHPHFVSGNQEIPFETVTSENWQEKFQDELTAKLDETNHLWKLMKVEKPEHMKDNVSRDVAFIFTFHHSIGDGLCKTRLVTTFFETLNQVLSSKIPEAKGHCLLPPLDCYIQPLVQRSSSEHFLFHALEKAPSNLSLQEIAQKKYLGTSVRKQNVFIEKMGAVCIAEPSVEAKTLIIPMKFTKAETENILRTCRAKDATMQGMLTAAASITMKELLDGIPESSKGINSVQIRTTVNMRRYLNGMVPEEYIGSYFVGLFGQDISIPKSANQGDQFWACASNSTRNLKNKLQGKQFITKFWNLIETVYHASKITKPHPIPSNLQNEPNRTNELLSLNNYGLCPSKGLPTDIVKLHSCFCAVAEHIKGPIFTLNAVTIEGQLCITFVYYTNITSKKIAVNFAGNIKSKILLSSNRPMKETV